MPDDLRTAMRSLRASPTFTAVALTVLALGIGAGTAIFSVVDAVVLRGLPFDEHDRLVAVLEHDTRRPQTFGGGRTTPQTYLDWRQLQESFEAVAGVGNEGALRMRSESGEPVEAQGLRLTHEFFRVFRVTPVLGRAFTAEDEIDGRHRVAILSHGSAVRAFLFETEPNDVTTMAAALAVLTAAGLLASAVPARRAASVDPLIALRHE